ncbi:uncharacterized protein BDR25DRAFT_359606 [Lindgomyces ingoldianus]|uniref:Uncharacterized protein n=1 Tax=Lindgomyces ingoldianus TaxID=673940 RepID=A0ACB6QH87_9PLEO|nr:uncharacterized protein BDR25DRAFT_359606 [Lindgomyces ingoldianus]KAF2466241.1 hypothetical protein BDR25DRAFT_359606 [Lindgomyces ingoldianus]
MADRTSAEGLPGPAFDPEAFPGPTSSSPRMIRHDTTSTVNSGNIPPISPGFYKLPIHGNCPRCHHRHKAATIKVSRDLSQVSHVYCERCGEKWLAFGGGNSTRISLLSTQTMDPDPNDVDFRSTLIEMVRSLTAVGSTAALASVPESPSRIPSREQSVKSTNAPLGQEQLPSSAGAPMTAFPERTDASQVTSKVFDAAPPSFPPPTGANIRGGAATKSPRRKALVAQLKAIKERIPFIKRLHLNQLMPSKKKAKVPDKDKGKQPVDQALTMHENPGTLISPAPNATPPKAPSNSMGIEILKTASDRHDPQKESVDTPHPGSLPHDNFKETLKDMTHDQRIAWVREMVTDSKCRCGYYCYCRRAPISATFPASSSGSGGTQVDASTLTSQATRQYLAQRRRSNEVFAVGGAFDDSHTRSSSPRRPTSIASLRTSQAPTIYGSEGMTATAGGPHLSFLGVAPPPRPRSRSPRPPSLPAGPSRLHEQISQDEISTRPTESSTSGRAVVSLPGARPVDGHGPSPWSPDLVVENNPPAQPEQRTPQSQEQSDAVSISAGDRQSIESVPHLNGYRTSDEHLLSSNGAHLLRSPHPRLNMNSYLSTTKHAIVFMVQRHIFNSLPHLIVSLAIASYATNSSLLSCTHYQCSDYFTQHHFTTELHHEPPRSLSTAGTSCFPLQHNPTAACIYLSCLYCVAASLSPAFLYIHSFTIYGYGLCEIMCYGELQSFSLSKVFFGLCGGALIGGAMDQRTEGGYWIGALYPPSRIHRNRTRTVVFLLRLWKKIDYNRWSYFLLFKAKNIRHNKSRSVSPPEESYSEGFITIKRVKDIPADTAAHCAPMPKLDDSIVLIRTRVLQRSTCSQIEGNIIYEYKTAEKVKELKLRTAKRIRCYYLDWRLPLDNGISFASFNYFPLVDSCDEQLWIRYYILGHSFMEIGSFPRSELRDRA